MGVSVCWEERGVLPGSYVSAVLVCFSVQEWEDSTIAKGAHPPFSWELKGGLLHKELDEICQGRAAKTGIFSARQLLKYWLLSKWEFPGSAERPGWRVGGRPMQPQAQAMDVVHSSAHSGSGALGHLQNQLSPTVLGPSNNVPLSDLGCNLPH